MPPEVTGDALADAYNTRHDEGLSLFPEAHETLDRLRKLDVKLALITNGATEPQRTKVAAVRRRTPFRPHPDRGESGFGKPEEQAYKHAMETLRGRPARDPDSRRTLNGRSWHHNGSASRRSGTTVTASAYPPTPRLAPTASFVASWNYCGSRTSWCASRAAVLLWFVAGNAASAQNAPGIGYDRAALTQAICQQYATAQKGMPYETMYAQCMYARGYRVPGFSPSPNSPGYQGELPGPATHNGGA